MAAAGSDGKGSIQTETADGQIARNAQLCRIGGNDRTAEGTRLIGGIKLEYKGSREGIIIRPGNQRNIETSGYSLLSNESSSSDVEAEYNGIGYTQL
ncbi:MAG: hypothetical protein LR015_14375 [Verrucomicrobia bacterium]|nr:hypothetical protein [Verrucomicrobiota bacterium]